MLVKDWRCRQDDIWVSLDADRMLHRSRRGRKDVGIIGQASWTSSVINLLNTSTSNNRE